MRSLWGAGKKPSLAALGHRGVCVASRCQLSVLAPSVTGVVLMLLVGAREGR